ncbi:MAG: hypothetical protein CMJ23_07915 [Phycisphaerae bacterium]|nr:hypothetical protein [Phycisphaerae bacterium]
MLRAVLIITALASLGCTGAGSSKKNTAQAVTPGFNHRIPESIMTPDKVETSIGTLRFFDGMPTEKTVETVYDNLDRTRATEVFLDFVPLASIEAFRRGVGDLGIEESNQILLYDGLMDSASLFLTGNTDTVYALAVLDLKRDGPTVIEIPPGAGPGTVNDAYFRFVTDMGGPGPDRGQGGKYLVLPPDHEGEIPEGYFVSKSRTYVNVVPLRGFLKDGKTDAAVEMWTKGLKVYPLADSENPPAMEFISGSGKVMNTIHANDQSFYDEVNDVIQREPIDAIDAELRGNLASIGIVKGRPFQPDDRMRKILRDAAAIGNATARALAFRPRSESIWYYGAQDGWFTAFDGADYRWLIDDGAGGRNKDARTLFFYIATVNTPAMVLKMIGKGSQYALSAVDSEGAYLDGGRDYSLTLPADIPAKDFWSIVVYDPQTRSMLQTDQPFPSKNNERNTDLVTNPDGSTTLWFGPEPPKGHETNWIQTVPDKAWFLCLRLYGPLEPWFEKTWRPGTIQPLN